MENNGMISSDYVVQSTPNAGQLTYEEQAHIEEIYKKEHMLYIGLIAISIFLILALTGSSATHAYQKAVLADSTSPVTKAFNAALLPFLGGCGLVAFVFTYVRKIGNRYQTFMSGSYTVIRSYLLDKLMETGNNTKKSDDSYYGMVGDPDKVETAAQGKKIKFAGEKKDFDKAVIGKSVIIIRLSCPTSVRDDLFFVEETAVWHPAYGDNEIKEGTDSVL